MEIHTSVQPLDMEAHDAIFNQANPALVFTTVNMKAKATSVTPKSLFP
jgi:hypothetical protein